MEFHFKEGPTGFFFSYFGKLQINDCSVCYSFAVDGRKNNAIVNLAAANAKTIYCRTAT